MYVEEKSVCIEKENVCFEEARRESIKKNEKKNCWYVSGCVQKKSTCFLSRTSPHSHFITNARTTMPFARLHFQMVCTQSEPAEIPQHMFVQILVQVGGDRKWRTSRTTLRTPIPLVIRDCFLVYCARTWKISFPPHLQMSETQITLSRLVSSV